MESLLLLLIACTSGEKEVGISDVALAETDVPSVFVATWKTNEEATGHIEYGENGAFDRRVAAASSDGLHHKVVLAGLGAGSTWDLRTVSTIDGEEEIGETVSLDVPGAPERISNSVVDDSTPERGGYFVACMPMPGDNIAAILDRSGRPTWWYTDTSEGELLQCRMSEDQSAVEMLIMGYGARFLRVSLTGEVLVDRPTGEIHHSFVQREGAGYYTLLRDIRNVDGTEVTGDAVVATNNAFKIEGELWNSWDHLPIPEAGPDSIDWTHANELSLDAAEEKMLVSLHELDTIVQIDVATGAMDWQMGGDASDFTQPAEATFHKQHGVRRIDGGLLIFDNGELEDDITESHSRVIELAVDEDAGTTELVREYTTPEGIYVPTLGNADLGDDGVVTVVWGSGGRINELLPDGEGYSVQYQLDMGLGAPFAYGHRVDGFDGAAN